MLRHDCWTAAAYWQSCSVPLVGVTPVHAVAPLFDWAAHAAMDALDIPQVEPSQAQPWVLASCVQAALVVSYWQAAIITLLGEHMAFAGEVYRHAADESLRVTPAHALALAATQAVIEPLVVIVVPSVQFEIEPFIAAL